MWSDAGHWEETRLDWCTDRLTTRGNKTHVSFGRTKISDRKDARRTKRTNHGNDSIDRPFQPDSASIDHIGGDFLLIDRLDQPKSGWAWLVRHRSDKGNDTTYGRTNHENLTSFIIRWYRGRDMQPTRSYVPLKNHLYVSWIPEQSKKNNSWLLGPDRIHR
jgi:hypothetical protein